ncbi:MAG: hypothetical protein LBC20_10685 [Planctomycetaceae bacterium]|jgi:hypothetical protein|nr:hypothetical protein [Planctomycetaceae bacterium]
MTKIQETFNQKLLVEGKDDQHVIWALCQQFNIKESFDVIDCGGVANLLEQIPQRLKQSGIESLGIIVDADIDLNARWQSIKNLLTVHQFEIPDQLPEEGLICQNADGITFGVWVMPNNKVNGMLEDFIAFLVPESDPLLPIAADVLNDIESRNLQKYSRNYKAKAQIHTWLAWQEEPGTPLGQSITKRYLSTDTETCLRLINWLKGLFPSPHILNTLH